MASVREHVSKSIAAATMIVRALIAGSNAVAAAGTSAIPRPEHPKPQFRRDAWINLNGQWDFAMDPDAVGIGQNWQNSPSRFNKKITVASCVESISSKKSRFLRTLPANGCGVTCI